VVVSPQTRAVTHLLVHRGLLPLLHHDVMVPIAAVGTVHEDIVQLNVPIDALNRMAAPEAADYVASAASWTPPQGYERGDVLLARPGPGDRLGQLVPRRQGRSADTAAEPGGVLIGSTTQVETVDRSIGTIDRVLVDPESGRVTHFVVRSGPFLAKHTIIPVDWAVKITPEQVRLAAHSEALRALPEYRPDDEIADEVIAALKGYPPIRRLLQGIESYEPPLSPYQEPTVRVRVEDGVVTLEGNVETSGHGSMAAGLAGQVPGVREVRNLLVADHDLEIAVANALGNDPRTRTVQARVESFLGTVTLTGQTPDAEARVAAEHVAAGVPGVRKVVNQLRVPPV
jgi:uncharacterized protein YrrD